MPEIETLPPFAPGLPSVMSGAWEIRRTIEPLKVGGQMVMAMRTAGPMPTQPAMHDALAVYASDEFVLDAALFVHEAQTAKFQRFRLASIDHGLYIHRPPKVDEWFVYRLESPIADNGRTFVRAEMRTAAGELFASVSQHALLIHPPATDGSA